MMIPEKYQKRKAIITLLLSQVRADSQYCQRIWQKLTAANRCCELYKANSKLNTLILTTHNGVLAHCGDGYVADVRDVRH